MSSRWRWRVLVALLLGAACAPPAHSACGTVFEVRVPEGTPTGGKLWLSGDRAELGSWNGAGVALAPLDDRRFVVRLELPEGAAMAFKVTRGSWDTVEKNADGSERANRTATVVCGDTVRVVVAAWRDQTEGPRAERVHSLIGTFRVHAAFPSRYVSAREVQVWLPPGYDSTATKRYPVVYFLDGQNVFDGATSFIAGSEWGVDETADRLIRSGKLPAFIAVAIANSSARMDEYTQDRDSLRGGGASRQHQRFLVEEVAPFIDAHYATRRDPRQTAIVGSSLGGLAALDLGLAHPERFGLIGSVSTSVWWADRAVVRRVSAGRGAGLRIWLDIGDSEEMGADGRRTVQDSEKLRDALVARGYREGRDLKFVVVPGARHNETAWAARVGEILTYLLSPR